MLLLLRTNINENCVGFQIFNYFIIKIQSSDQHDAEYVTIKRYGEILNDIGYPYLVKLVVVMKDINVLHQQASCICRQITLIVLESLFNLASDITSSTYSLVYMLGVYCTSYFIFGILYFMFLHYVKLVIRFYNRKRVEKKVFCTFDL